MFLRPLRCLFLGTLTLCHIRKRNGICFQMGDIATRCIRSSNTIFIYNSTVKCWKLGAKTKLRTFASR